jgi:SAM-dependent methyltransferase
LASHARAARIGGVLLPDVLAYYERMGERERLTGPARGRLEFLRTWDLLQRVLPPPPAAVLDVGGATGVYAGALAAAGYAVHVVDPVPSHVEIAGALPGVTAAVGDARSLTLPDAGVDAVLLLGPLYHLIERGDRLRAWREAARVVRPGGVVAAATIARYASAFDAFTRGAFRVPGYAEMIAETFVSGVHRPPVGSPWFATAYFHEPMEAAAEAAEAGLAVGTVANIEGPVWMVGRIEEIFADDTERDHLMAVLRHVEEDPALFGAGSHLLTVAHRPD